MKTIIVLAVVAMGYMLSKNPPEKQPMGDPLPAHYPTKGKEKS
jgi:hypothetical protein